MIKAEKHRFVILIDKDSYEKFRELAEEQNRSASNLGAIVIKDYIKNTLNFYFCAIIYSIERFSGNIPEGETEIMKTGK